jgi:hypothetical protein
LDDVDGMIDIAIVRKTDMVNNKAMPELNMSDGFLQIRWESYKQLEWFVSKQLTRKGHFIFPSRNLVLTLGVLRRQPEGWFAEQSFKA